MNIWTNATAPAASLMEKSELVSVAKVVGGCAIVGLGMFGLVYVQAHRYTTKVKRDLKENRGIELTAREEDGLFDYFLTGDPIASARINPNNLYLPKEVKNG